LVGDFELHAITTRALAKTPHRMASAKRDRERVTDFGIFWAVVGVQEFRHAKDVHTLGKGSPG
jgi:hypothetical protein